MSTRVVRAVAWWLLAGGVGSGTWAAEAGERDPELGAAIEAAAFSPIGAAEVSRARARLLEAIQRLEARFQRAGPEAAGWRAYLRWPVLKEEMAREPGPDLSVLDEIYARFDAGHYGLGLVWFKDVRVALRHYLLTARAMGDPQMEAKYRTVLRMLQGALARLEAAPTAENAYAVDAILLWLEEAGQGQGLIRTIRRRYGEPNLRVRVSAGLVSAGIHRPVDETAPVRDVILGADVFGEGRTVGQVTGELLPAEGHVALRVVLRASNRSRTVSYKGPARVYSRVATALTGWKRAVVDAEGVRLAPAEAEARTQSTLTGVGSKRGSRLVQRAACRRATRQKCQAEWIAARHAERDLRARLDAEVAELADQANTELEGKILGPLRDRGLLPSAMAFSSTEAAAELTVTAARSFELAAPSPPPVDHSGDLVISVHQSMVNNFSADVLAGMRMTDEQIRQEIEGLAGQVPEALRRPEGGKPWSITFAAQQPVLVSFDENRFAVTVRGQSFTRGGERHPGMSVTAEYRIVREPGGWVAVRQGPLQTADPAGGRYGIRRGVRSPQIREQFQKLFPERIVSEAWELPGLWAKAGPLELIHWETRSGWMTLAFGRAASARGP